MLKPSDVCTHSKLDLSLDRWSVSGFDCIGKTSASAEFISFAFFDK